MLHHSFTSSSHSLPGLPGSLEPKLLAPLLFYYYCLCCSFCTRPKKLSTVTSLLQRQLFSVSSGAFAFFGAAIIGRWENVRNTVKGCFNTLLLVNPDKTPQYDNAGTFTGKVSGSELALLRRLFRVFRVSFGPVKPAAFVRQHTVTTHPCKQTI